jgi:UDPglucose--hexose-1-phosphate uridylyltransferase
MEDLWLKAPHRRWNSLRREWVVVSPNRTQRPWQGQTEPQSTSSEIQFDPSCYLCPGNARAGGQINPQYKATYVFENDFAAMRPDAEAASFDIDNAGLLRAETERGICRVLCFDPRHDLTLATMRWQEVRLVVDMWDTQIAELGSREEIGYVQIFENRGFMMGASNPHPHGQVWAIEHIPNEPLVELESQLAYYARHCEPMLQAYQQLELKLGERLVSENANWIAVVPFWAVWPFELLLLPKRSMPSFAQMTHQERDGLAQILHKVTAGYNHVFNTPFPYSMGFHPAPTDGEAHAEWTLHAHFYPPLLRSATVRKFMVGFELLGSPQRDISPERAAQILRKAMQ